MSKKNAFVVGTFDTKSEELNYIVGVLKTSGPVSYTHLTLPTIYSV